MKRKSRSDLTSKRHKNNATCVIWAVVLLITLFCPYATLAVDEECDPNSMIFTSPANNLCVPAISSNTRFVIDGQKTVANPGEWAANTFYEFGNLWNAGSGSRVWVSRKATGINKSDLYLLFETGSDSVPAGLDEIRIGLNPGTTATNSTLVKIHPFPVGATLPKEVLTFAGPGWTSTGSGDAWLPPANVANHSDVAGALWSVEVRIPLDMIPVNPIATPDFRLSLQVLANNGVMTMNYQWPDQALAASNNDMCSNPNRWFPMSFSTGAGGNCPHPDLDIAGGLYSCDAIYVLRAGLKSSEIGINEINEFHADVNNPGPGAAPNTEVYLTLLQMGTSTGPIAMNYDNGNAAITQFFTDKYGGWMTANAKLDTGTPKPPVPFTANPGLNTAARFNWKPADETNFGPPAGFVGTHKCTAAFVNFKDDPNFANNFSFCNTSIVKCPAGEICPLSFWIGQIYPSIRPRDNIRGRFLVTAINEPFAGWLEKAQFNVDGEKVQRINERVFEAALPVKGEAPLKISITPPPIRKAELPTGGAGLIPEVRAQPKQPDADNPGDPIQERNYKLKKIYGDRPIILVQQFVPTSWETGLDGKSREQLYAPTAYVAFAVDMAAGGGNNPSPSTCACGRASARSLALSSLIAFLGIAFIGRRVSRKTKSRRDAKTG